MRYRLFLLALIPVAGCDNEHSLGTLSPLEGLTTDASVPGMLVDAAPVSNTPDARVLGEMGTLQSWTGYLESYQLSIGSDTVRLSFANDSSGQVTGTVTFGEGTPPPPATDPTVGYPPGVADVGMSGLLWAPLPGFPYSIVAGSYASGRLRIGIDILELWAGWCAMQTQGPDGSPNCGPNGFSATYSGGTDGQPCVVSVTTNGGKKLQYDCGWFRICVDAPTICLCSPAGCSANWTPGGSITFDMFLVGDTASGSVRESSGTYNVHFMKNPEPGRD
jgi:hypothetical protein